MACPDCFKAHFTPALLVEPRKPYMASEPMSLLHQEPQNQQSSSSLMLSASISPTQTARDYYAAQTGARVLVPDIIPGGGVPLTTLSLTEAVTTPPSWWDVKGRAWWVVSLVQLLSIVIPFGIRSKNVFPTIVEYARSVKKDLPEGGKLGVAGFCWGGLQTTKLSAEPAVEGGTEGLVDVHFAAHPVSLKPEDFVAGVKNFGVPFSMAVGEKDAYLKPDAVAGVEAALRTEVGEGNGWEVKIYPDCGHGFAVRADEGRVVENEAAGKAAEQAVALFKKHLV